MRSAIASAAVREGVMTRKSSTSRSSTDGRCAPRHRATLVVVTVPGSPAPPVPRAPPLTAFSSREPPSPLPPPAALAENCTWPMPVGGEWRARTLAGVAGHSLPAFFQPLLSEVTTGQGPTLSFLIWFGLHSQVWIYRGGGSTGNSGCGRHASNI